MLVVRVGESGIRCRGVTEARRPRRTSGADGVCGSLAAGHRRIPRFPGGAALREPPLVGVSVESGPPFRGPYAAAVPVPARASGVDPLRADRFLEGSVGAIGWSSAARRCAGGYLPRRPGAIVRPCQMRGHPAQLNYPSGPFGGFFVAARGLGGDGRRSVRRSSHGVRVAKEKR